MGRDDETKPLKSRKKQKVKHNTGSSAPSASASNGAIGAGAMIEPPPPPDRPSQQPTTQQRSVVPPISGLSLGLARPFWAMCACCSLPREERTGSTFGRGSHNRSEALEDVSAEQADGDSSTSIVPRPERNLVLPGQNDGSTAESLIHQYISACHLFGAGDRINAGVLTTLRFSLPTLRVSGSFHDADMLALGEILLPHCNSLLKYIKRLDFSIASREGKLHGRRGFRSHGAFTLSKILSSSENIKEVFLQRNKIGPYGSSAIFIAAGTNPCLRTLVMRRCAIGERGARAFAEHVCKSDISGLREVDLSVNSIGFSGSVEVETALSRREEGRKIECDLEGNLVLQEVMNCVTHGLGIILSVVAFFALSRRAQHHSHRHIISCAI